MRPVRPPNDANGGHQEAGQQSANGQAHPTGASSLFSAQFYTAQAEVEDQHDPDTQQGLVAPLAPDVMEFVNQLQEATNIDVTDSTVPETVSEEEPDIQIPDIQEISSFCEQCHHIAVHGPTEAQEAAFVQNLTLNNAPLSNFCCFLTWLEKVFPTYFS
ncbi:Hypothetical Protein FCC1311_028242 [Hondaea fermentalgiana]|uniref:Uncharacterized protein n=1 Tax=Hondaea fermentalgiana TaxID=2315210 RepID=A0A2R5GDA1_9STRA|nr:Hypothetical Protein FCC1311_028242 [Hondaea fermentalgiana]|eukprot:GBG26603.1 Hypothetical Protein FCC1311_028242 [Hondaea fermentalgiana]